MSGQLERCEREWHELEGEFQELQETHRIYKQKLEELTALQTLCSASISKQKRHLKDLKRALQRYKRHSSQEEAELIQQIGANIKERQNVFFDMEAYLPKKNGLYLNLVLGNVNVTLLSNQAKFAYKDEYEKFKLYLTIILLLGAVACRFFLHYRVTDEVFNFLLVWYYCTLTIRESILISNGSRIKGWWVSHHYVSTFLSGVMLTWPNGLIYQKFRNQFLAFSIFQTWALCSPYRLCSVPTVLLPEGLPLQIAGPGGEEPPGPHGGRVPVLDVAGPHLSPAFPFLWPFLATLQCRHVV
ncbi:transmembrane protein 120B isoform X4 [Peromyscus leucopus]|uniref:transmembrane protein 120B isoform X4 n=1 Tax=Peromyscus leucopus TaxID=10041 RepID=UPI00188531FB|nr:transmembrane protein 120B isoform X4 [Peromyscus leucopus]